MKFPAAVRNYYTNVTILCFLPLLTITCREEYTELGWHLDNHLISVSARKSREQLLLNYLLPRVKIVNLWLAAQKDQSVAVSIIKGLGFLLQSHMMLPRMSTYCFYIASYINHLREMAYFKKGYQISSPNQFRSAGQKQKARFLSIPMRWAFSVLVSVL